MKVSSIPAIILGLISLSLPACERTHAQEKEKEHAHEENQQKIVVTSPLAKNVTFTQSYVSQIRSQNYIEVRALQDGYLQEVAVKEGQTVKEGEVMFAVNPTLYKARLSAEQAEANQAQIEAEQSQQLAAKNVVSQIDVALAKAKLDKANAKVKLAEAELNFATVRAPFDGIVDRQLMMRGSLVEKKDVLTTLSDNSVMRVYFNVPEVLYLEYRASQERGAGIESQQIELVLANGNKFPQSCLSVTVMGKVNNETGNIPFRADFPNPNALLRHGQTGKILVHHTLPNAIVIPQRATFETLDKHYVFVVGEDHVMHQREIAILHEMDDIFVIKHGLNVNDKIVLGGVRQVREGEKKEFEFMKPEEALANQKKDAE